MAGARANTQNQAGRLALVLVLVAPKPLSPLLGTLGSSHQARDAHEDADEQKAGQTDADCDRHHDEHHSR